MHTEMWQNPATVANIAELRERGVTIVGPGSGQLTGTDSGLGRMVEPDEIVAAALAVVGPKDLVGKRIVITAGGTREPLDPVRFIGNRSSGKQGIAIALDAAARGAEVVLIGANLEIAAPASATIQHLTVSHVSTTKELEAATMAAAADADVVIMAAAVADYRPQSVAENKIKKETQGDRLTLELVRNPDILRELSEARRDGQIVIGFAAETETNREKLLETGRAKVVRKGADFLVLNTVGWTEGFATETNSIIVINTAGDIVSEATGSKSSVAARILDLLS
jgi:phosphopantothenoylcysteine decarboxylase/phosphopantothenate--cysteine ligase